MFLNLPSNILIMLALAGVLFLIPLLLIWVVGNAISPRD